MRILARQYIWNYLRAHKCVDCGENDPIVLEFDHISNKTEPVAVLVRNGLFKAVKEEIKKCEVRCANCHRRITAKRAGWSRDYDQLPP